MLFFLPPFRSSLHKERAQADTARLAIWQDCRLSYGDQLTRMAHIVEQHLHEHEDPVEDVEKDLVAEQVAVVPLNILNNAKD